MDRKLILRNFQIHEYLEVDLSQPITSIVGPSDIGKSAILRALKWLCFNRPGGDSFVRGGEVGTSVTLFISKHKIVRLRSKTRNVYILDGVEFKAIGTNVPDDISSILRVREENFQVQHDSPFWFHETPGQVSKELNQIVNLGVIDDSLSKVATSVRKARGTLEVSQSRLKDAKLARANLKWIMEMNDSLQELKEIESKLDKNRVESSALHILLQNVKYTQDSKEIASDARISGVWVLTKADRAHKVSRDLENLRSLLLKAKTASQDASLAPPDLTRLKSTSEQVTRHKSLTGKLTTLLSNIEEVENETCKAKEWAERGQEELTKKTKGKCPICGAQM